MISPKHKYELELCLFGMKDDVLANTVEEADSWDVELHLRFPDTGEIKVLFESSDPVDFDTLERLFPTISQNIWPER